jgi:hypothetical protein
MAGEGSQEGGHADEIIGADVYRAQRPQKKEFLPWHRPRKQFVRDRQWYQQIDKLIDDLQLDGAPLRYLGLPGVDLLDLRFFHLKICTPRQLQLRFLGFNSGAHPNSPAQIEMNISMDEVRRLEYIDKFSEVISDDFRRVSNKDSIAWRKTHALGPYEVVNLDLCDGFAAQQPGTFDDNHYNAMSQLLSLQCRNKNPWLLLLTTRAGEDCIDPGVLGVLVGLFLDNLNGCAEFREASSQKFGFHDGPGLEAAADTPDGLLRIFLTGLCKWLLGFAVGTVPQWKLELKSVIGYRVEAGASSEDLFSLAIRFDPLFTPIADALDIANQENSQLNECVLATQVLNRVAGRKNADQILTADPGLNTEMVGATASLLEIARYDVSAFHQWCGDGCP